MKPAVVMPGLVPGIHVLKMRVDFKDVDGRDRPGHDEADILAAIAYGAESVTQRLSATLR